MRSQFLTDDQISVLTRLRHALHSAPELSGEERATAGAISAFLRLTEPDAIIEGLGGSGLAVIYEGRTPGPTVMFRAELDGLPITERSNAAHRSKRHGLAHACGHDGHMAILAGLGVWLGQKRPAHGRVVLLFQPAEETGAGARAVLADPKFAPLRPDWAFAMHNMPGLPLGALAVAAGPASCASVGLHLRYQGRAAHASMPETGLSPARALAGLMAEIASQPDAQPMGPEFRLATLCHLSMGAPSFGIAPGHADVSLTLRTVTDAALDDFESAFIEQAKSARGALDLTVSRHDHFNASHNDKQAAGHVARAGQTLGMKTAEFALPMRPSEDFGAFSATTRTALFFLGAGEAHPALHNPDYDFPDALISPGYALFAEVLAQVMAATR